MNCATWSPVASLCAWNSDLFVQTNTCVKYTHKHNERASQRERERERESEGMKKTHGSAKLASASRDLLTGGFSKTHHVEVSKQVHVCTWLLGLILGIRNSIHHPVPVGNRVWYRCAVVEDASITADAPAPGTT